MKVAHFAPFAPNRCGLYEAARDFARADSLRDHEVLFVDTGVVESGKRAAPVVNGLDPRGGWLLRTSDWREALDADLWVCHDGVDDAIAARCQVPMIWALHGRPLACFRPEQEGCEGQPFSIVTELALWPRVKALVTMWEEFVPFWEPVCNGKLRSTDLPPIDRARYKPTGKRYDFGDKTGAHNVVICDSWRSDVDVYEVAMGCYHAAKQRPGLKVHFFAVEGAEKQGPWQHVWRALDEIGALGVIHGRIKEIEDVYRAADAVVSPHSIGVRTILEAVSCGAPVVAGPGCVYTGFRASASSPLALAREILRCLDEGAGSYEGLLLDLDAFGARLELIYEEALGCAPVGV